MASHILQDKKIGAQQQFSHYNIKCAIGQAERGFFLSYFFFILASKKVMSIKKIVNSRRNMEGFHVFSRRETGFHRQAKTF